MHRDMNLSPSVNAVVNGDGRLAWPTIPPDKFIRLPQFSRWREFHLVYHPAIQAIVPSLALQPILGHWNQIAVSLAEPSRKRRPQIENVILALMGVPCARVLVPEPPFFPIRETQNRTMTNSADMLVCEKSINGRPFAQ